MAKQITIKVYTIMLSMMHFKSMCFSFHGSSPPLNSCRLLLDLGKLSGTLHKERDEQDAERRYELCDKLWLKNKPSTWPVKDISTAHVIFSTFGIRGVDLLAEVFWKGSYLWRVGYLWKGGYFWRGGYLWRGGYFWRGGYMWRGGRFWNGVKSLTKVNGNRAQVPGAPNRCQISRKMA